MNDAVSLDRCPNCGSHLTGRYCAECGQKAAPINPTVGHIAHELVQELLSFDGKIFRSVWLLLTRPGLLTRELLAGRRVSYVSPIRLYLVFSIAYFAIAALEPAGGINVDPTLRGDETPEQLRTIELQKEQFIETIRNIAINWVPRAMAALVPVFAALVMWLSGQRRRHYPQHLYFALHTHAAWFAAGTVSALCKWLVPGPIAETITGGAGFYTLGYFPLAFGYVYRTGIVSTLWRSAVIGSLYVLIAGITLAALFLTTILPMLRTL